MSITAGEIDEKRRKKKTQRSKELEKRERGARDGMG